MVPQPTVDTGNGAAHGITKIVELPDWISNLDPVENHGRRLPTSDMNPVEQGPAFLFGCLPAAGGAVDKTIQVVTIRARISYDLDVTDLCEADARKKRKNDASMKYGARLHDPPRRVKKHMCSHM